MEPFQFIYPWTLPTEFKVITLLLILSGTIGFGLLYWAISDKSKHKVKLILFSVPLMWIPLKNIVTYQKIIFDEKLLRIGYYESKNKKYFLKLEENNTLITNLKEINKSKKWEPVITDDAYYIKTQNSKIFISHNHNLKINEIEFIKKSSH